MLPALAFSVNRLILLGDTWAPVPVPFLDFIYAELSVNMHVLKVKRVQGTAFIELPL